MLDGASVTLLRRSPRSLAKDLRRSAWGDTGFRIPADEAGGCKADVRGHFPLCSLIRVLGLSFFRRRYEERRECTRREQLVGWQESHDHAMPCAWDDIQGGRYPKGGGHDARKPSGRLHPIVASGEARAATGTGQRARVTLEGDPSGDRPPTTHPPMCPCLCFSFPPVTHGTGAFDSCVIAMHLQPKLGSQCSVWDWQPSMREFKGRAGFLSSGVGITGMNTGSGLGFWQQIPGHWRSPVPGGNNLQPQKVHTRMLQAI